MEEIVFIIFIVLYFLLAAKIDEWYTISALGFKSATPEMFLRKPWRYSIVRSALFLATIGISFFTTLVPWYICLVVLAIVWFVAGVVGRIRASNKYRLILHEMIEYCDSPEQRAELEAKSNKTDKELLDEVKRYRSMMKYFPNRWI